MHCSRTEDEKEISDSENILQKNTLKKLFKWEFTEITHRGNQTCNTLAFHIISQQKPSLTQTLLSHNLPIKTQYWTLSNLIPTLRHFVATQRHSTFAEHIFLLGCWDVSHHGSKGWACTHYWSVIVLKRWRKGNVVGQNLHVAFIDWCSLRGPCKVDELGRDCIN